jgi:hypothetical protein
VYVQSNPRQRRAYVFQKEKESRRKHLGPP